MQILTRRWWRSFFTWSVRTRERIIVKNMSPETAKHFEAAFTDMDKAFQHMDNAFDKLGRAFDAATREKQD